MSTVIQREDGTFLTFDAVMEEGFSPSSSVTDHPVEDGSTVSDHILRQPLTITVKGLITESPYQSSNVAIATGTQRVQQVLEFLEALSQEVVTLVSMRLGTYENMVLVAWPHRIGRLRNLPIDLTFKQVRLATAGFVDIPPEIVAESQEAGAPDEQDVGEQAGEATTDAEGEDTEGATEDKSFLAELFGF